MNVEIAVAAIAEVVAVVVLLIGSKAITIFIQLVKSVELYF